MLDWKLEQCQNAAPEGWAALLEELYIQLEAVPINIEVHQVKSKFGGLRFYYGVDYDENDEALRETVRRLVDAAEAESYKICEDCGAVGAPKQVGYWMTTQCEACNIKSLTIRKNLWKDA
jgi:hypothetical protein